MSSRRNLILSGVVALALAASLLGAGLLIGFLPRPSSSSFPSPGGSQSAGLATLSILLTDPPTVPTGVSAIYVSYDGVEIHEFGADASTPNGGWTKINVSGTVDVLSLINVSVTVAQATVSAGTYDMVRLDLSSVVVDFGGQNVSVSSRPDSVVTTIPGNVNLYASTRVSVLIDLQSTVLNVNSAQEPTFIFSASAWSAQVPLSAQSSAYEQVGAKSDLGQNSWWQTYVKTYSANITITTATVSSNFISVTVKNVGNASTVLHIVTVASASYVSSTQPPTKNPQVIADFLSSLVYEVLPNASLVPFETLPLYVTSFNSSASLPYPPLTASGYLLQPGESVTLTYSGQVAYNLTAQIFRAPYVVTVIGDNAMASIMV
jgi:hypothetical protein